MINEPVIRKFEKSKEHKELIKLLDKYGINHNSFYSLLGFNLDAKYFPKKLQGKYEIDFKAKIFIKTTRIGKRQFVSRKFYNEISVKDNSVEIILTKETIVINFQEAKAGELC